MKKEEIINRIVEILMKHQSEVMICGSASDCILPIRYDIIAMEISWLYEFDVPGQLTEDGVNEYFKDK